MDQRPPSKRLSITGNDRRYTPALERPPANSASGFSDSGCQPNGCAVSARCSSIISCVWRTRALRPEAKASARTLGEISAINSQQDILRISSTLNHQCSPIGVMQRNKTGEMRDVSSCGQEPYGHFDYWPSLFRIAGLCDFDLGNFGCPSIQVRWQSVCTREIRSCRSLVSNHQSGLNEKQTPTHVSR